MLSLQRLGILKVALAAALWGTWSIFLRNAERYHPVDSSALVFVCMVGVFLAFLPAVIRTPFPQEGRAKLLGLLALGGLADGVNNLSFFAAMQRTSVAIAVVTHYLAPVFITLLAVPLLKERLTRAGWQGLLASLIGLALMLRPWEQAAASAWVGAGLGALSAVFYALNVLIARGLQGKLAPMQILVWRIPVTLALVVPFLSRDAFQLPPGSWSWLVAGTLLPGILAGWLFFSALPVVPASLVSVMTLCEPMVATLVGWCVWQEQLPPIGVVGALLILAGAARVFLGQKANSGGPDQALLPGAVEP